MDEFRFSSIEMCEDCEGVGQAEYEMTDGKYKRIDCKECKGTGRVIKVWDYIPAIQKNLKEFDYLK